MRFKIRFLSARLVIARTSAVFDNRPKSLRFYLGDSHATLWMTMRAIDITAAPFGFSFCVQSTHPPSKHSHGIAVWVFARLNLRAKRACAVSDCENKCGFWQSPQKFAFLFRRFPRYALNDDAGDWHHRSAVWFFLLRAKHAPTKQALARNCGLSFCPS